MHLWSNPLWTPKCLQEMVTHQTISDHFLFPDDDFMCWLDRRPLPVTKISNYWVSRPISCLESANFIIRSHTTHQSKYLISPCNFYMWGTTILLEVLNNMIWLIWEFSLLNFVVVTKYKSWSVFHTHFYNRSIGGGVSQWFYTCPSTGTGWLIPHESTILKKFF
jgi:hypothetical protein